MNTTIVFLLILLLILSFKSAVNILSVSTPEKMIERKESELKKSKEMYKSKGVYAFAVLMMLAVNAAVCFYTVQAILSLVK